MPESLGVVGLDPAEETVYRRLTSEGPSTLAELASALGAANSSLRRSLTALEAAGLVSQTATRPVKFSATPPALGLASLVVHQEQQLERVRLEIQQLQQEFEKGAGRVSSAGIVELVEGEESIVRRMDQLFRSVTDEVLTLDKPPYTRPPAENVIQEVHLRAGISYRTVYSQASLEYPGALASALSGIESGEEARVLPDLPIKLHIFDRRVGLLPLVVGEDRHIEGHLIVYSSLLLEALIAMWEMLFERGVPLTPDRVKDAPGKRDALDEDDEALALLLLSGAKVAVIAKQLHVGVTTVERRIKKLMRALDATTRVQVGYQLARRELSS